MISDPTDPVVQATLALEDAQRAYDAAMVSGQPLGYQARYWLAMRLAVARRGLRSAIYGYDDRIDESATLTYLLSALAPVETDEE